MPQKTRVRIGMTSTARRSSRALAGAYAFGGLPAVASAAGSFQDSAADVLAVIVLILVPTLGIGLFWLVHILPEKVAEKREHPQKDAIKVLCLLSLFFGGLLWPLAWLWAYSKPVFYKMAYGEDKHEDFFAHGSEGQEQRRVTATDPVGVQLPLRAERKLAASAAAEEER
jgi:CBS domain containing-hemolysin-like protein